ncbi:hypothetical protein [Aquisphaera insulae]|uniref:hypothetical protein n=1 Tax=Aquisphaera insulae TaxID=2712864 RepID=UPI0013EAC6E5|nr:hypothetical protein [Aquisphaera insulae]
MSSAGLERLLIFGPILFLIAVGAWIASRSGVARLSTGQDYLKLAGNLSQMALRIVGYVVLLIGIQYMVGLRPTLGW